MENRTTCGQRCVSLWNTFNRTKTINKDKIEHTELKRCLNLFDLTTLGKLTFHLLFKDYSAFGRTLRDTLYTSNIIIKYSVYQVLDKF